MRRYRCDVNLLSVKDDVDWIVYKDFSKKENIYCSLLL